MKQLRSAEPIEVALEGARIVALHWRSKAYAVREQGDEQHYRGGWYTAPGFAGSKRVYLPLETNRGQIEVYREEEAGGTAWFITRMWD